MSVCAVCILSHIYCNAQSSELLWSETHLYILLAEWSKPSLRINTVVLLKIVISECLCVGLPIFLFVSCKVVQKIRLSILFT